MKYKKMIFELAKQAEKYDCVPVGAIIVQNNTIIGKGYNKKEKTNNPLDHAEIIAIKQACKKINNWNLEGCKLYTTMKPCNMCISVIKEVRINEIEYFVDNLKEKYKNNKKDTMIQYNNINEQMYAKKYLQVLKRFFKEKRKKSNKNIL